MAGGFTTVGVVLKIGYDTTATRRVAKGAGLDRFAQERREVYEQFYAQVQQQRMRAFSRIMVRVGEPLTPSFFSGAPKLTPGCAPLLGAVKHEGRCRGLAQA